MKLTWGLYVMNQILLSFLTFLILSFKDILYSFLFLFIWFDSNPFCGVGWVFGLSQIFHTTPNAFGLPLRMFL